MVYSPIQPPADKTLNYTGCHRVSKNDNPKCDSQHGTRAAKPSAHTITWLEAQHDPKRVPRARLVTNVPCRPGARARGTPIGVPAARQHAQSARSYPLLMRHRKASPTAPVRNSCNERPDHARPAAPRAAPQEPLGRVNTHALLHHPPHLCPRRCWLLYDG